MTNFIDIAQKIIYFYSRFKLPGRDQISRAMCTLCVTCVVHIITAGMVKKRRWRRHPLAARRSQIYQQGTSPKNAARFQHVKFRLKTFVFFLKFENEILNRKTGVRPTRDPSSKRTRGLENLREKMDFDVFNENYREERANPGPNDVSVCGPVTIEGETKLNLLHGSGAAAKVRLRSLRSFRLIR